MFKILDFTEALHMLSIVEKFLIILAISIALTALILMRRASKQLDHEEISRYQALKRSFSLWLLASACVAIVTSSYYLFEGYLINPVSASTDHYSFEISNNKYISLHPTQSRDVRMEFDTSNLTVNYDDKTRVNMLEIVSETEDRFICEAKSQSKSETIELMKNEHRFVRK